MLKVLSILKETHFGREYQVVCCRLLLGPTATTCQSTGMPSRSQLTSHRRLATVLLRPLAETHATWQSLEGKKRSLKHRVKNGVCSLPWVRNITEKQPRNDSPLGASLSGRTSVCPVFSLFNL